MGRTRLTPKRLLETRKENIGHIIIFCEGLTEKYYFDYFAAILKKNKYTRVEVVLENAGGNARAVLNYADAFMADEANNRKYGNYGKYLVFDCDAPPNIQKVIQDAADYKLLISNYLFETWLLMHFEDVEDKLPKSKIYKRLTDHLRIAYAKGDEGITRAIVQNGNIEKAIDNAKELEQKYNKSGKTMIANVKEMNPYTNVYKLIEQFLVEISV